MHLDPEQEIPQKPKMTGVLLFVGLFILGVTVQQTFSLQNADLFWHLRIGELMMDTGGLLSQDPLTFNAEGKAWIQHEWGAQLMLAAVHRLGGWWGLRILRGLLVGLTLAFLALAFWHRCPRAAAVVMGLGFYWVLVEPFSIMRPHLVGWLLLAIGYYLFLSVQGPWRKLRWFGYVFWLVAWVNIHSSAVIVPGLCALAAAEVLIRMMVLRHRNFDLAWHWIRMGALGVAAVLLQPAGLDLTFYVIEIQALNNVASTEWLHLFRLDIWQGNQHLIVFFVMLTALTLLASFLSYRRKEPGEAFPLVLPALAALFFAFSTRRMLFLTYIPIHLVLREAHAWFLFRRDTWQGLLRRRWLMPLMAGLLVISVLVWSFERRPGPLEPGPFAPGWVAEKGVAFLQETQLQGRMVNIDYWGGFLAYYLHPQYKTFIDGRWLMVGQQAFKDMIAMMTHKPNMESLADRYGIDFIVQPVEVWSKVLPPDSNRWVLAYQDEMTVIALRRGDRFDENARRVCAYYARHPEQSFHVRWPESTHPVCQERPCLRIPSLRGCPP